MNDCHEPLLISDEILKKAAEAELSLIPKKSEEIYKKEYDKFWQWLRAKNTEIVTEKVVLAYFLDQADYTRHLEETARRTENLLLRTVQECMIQGARDEGAQILRKWEKFSALLRKGTETQTMAEETQFFLEKLKNLDEIWTHLLSHNSVAAEIKQDIKCVQEEGLKLVQTVIKEGNLNAGGKFEWVDSILIKCLRDGSWLLVDNVNLCSPAVLDRLNALLEPNGVLIIGERGVKENGEMVEIKPHKDFRLFLTMDPKNGEISRAMRNRGIEICMLNENESEVGNLFDTKSLISRAGLKDNAHIEALLKMHCIMSSITLGEKPNVNQLLQAAFLISQQLLRGENVFTAFNYAIVDVYYKSRSPSEFETSDTQNLVECELKNIFSAKMQLQPYSPDDVTLMTVNLSANSYVEKIRQQSALLVSKAPKNLPVLQNLLINFYGITNLKDLNLRYMYLQKYLDNTLLSAASKKFFEVFTQTSMYDNVDLPLDLHWLPDSVFKTATGLNTANKLHLLLYFTSNLVFNESEHKENFPKRKEITLLQFLEGVRNKKVEGKIDDVLETDLLNVVDAFDQFFIESIQIGNLEISDKNVVDIISFLQWRFRLYHLTEVNLHEVDLSSYTDLIQNLHVHYRWFYKFAIKQLSSTLGARISDCLSNFVHKINLKTIDDFSLLKKLAKAFQKSISKPPPLINDKQVEVYGDFQKISTGFDLYNIQNDFTKVLKILFRDQTLRISLIDAKQDITFELSDSLEHFPHIKQMYDKYITAQEVCNEPKQTAVDILPILDHFSRIAVNVIKGQANALDGNDQILKETITVPPNLVGVLQRYNKTGDVRLRHELKSEIFYYLLNCASVAPFKFKNFALDSEGEVYKEPFSHFAPVLSYLLTDLLVADTNSKEMVKTTSFGQYRDVANQHRMLNSLLWHNLQQISSGTYDFVCCEATYVLNAYTEFIKHLSQALSVPLTSNNANISELTQICIAQIKAAYKRSDINDVNNDQTTVITLLQQCVGEVAKINHEGLLCEKLNAISSAHFLTSYLKTLFNSKLPIIDPLAKVQVKKQYCLDEIEKLACMNDCYKLQNEVYSGSNATLHSYVALLGDKITTLKEKDAELGKHVAVRPSNVTYAFISKEIKHHFAMVLSPQQITKLFNDLNDYFSIVQDAINNKVTISTQGAERCGREALQYCSSYVKLIEILRKHRCSYPDIIEPVLSNITEFLYAVRLKTSLHYKVLAEYNNLQSEIDLRRDLVSIIRFPVLNDEQPDFLKIITSYTGRKIQDFIKKSLQSDSDQQLWKRENFRLLKCGIQDLYNICVLNGKNFKIFDKELFQEFDSLLKVFVKAWKQQEEELEQKRKEEESLYKMKPKSEDQEVEDHFKELFPSFHEKDFSDMQDVGLGDTPDSSSPETLGHYAGVITMEDVKFVSQIHSQLLQLCTTTEWLNPEKKNTQCDYVTPLVQKCKLFKLLLNKYGECLEYTVDADILGCLNVLVAVAQHFGDTKALGEQNTDSPRNQTRKRYDFYKDSQIEEVKGSYHILEELRLRIVELLSEWPGHPTLQTIHTIIQRIKDFDMTSPLSRFLTGFEILLSKCHEWEQNAHAGVSLSQYTQNLIHQIIAWRKIEMSMWKNSLNNVFDRMNEPLSKWWFYIYEVMLQFIQGQFSSEELVSTLQNFMTKSNLAEFEGRLGLLLTFHCHAVHLDCTQRSGVFVNVLWNVREYFKQFLPNVQAKISELRAPIEKKLREYVKIVKWKDISYWAVKETVEKTHKTLHKHIREFEDVLKQPASVCLTNTGPQNKQIENVGIWDRPQRQSPKTYHYTMDPATYMAKRSLSKKIQVSPNEPSDIEQGILTKAEKYFYKSRVLCKSTVLATSYPSLIQSLDGFVSDVIEASGRLQGLEMDTTLPKNKQKSQAKGILQQKRKALADLFKTLSSVGLSYRTGLVQSKVKNQSGQFLMKPIDLFAAFEHLNYSRFDEKLLTIWDGCEMYYRKAQMRLYVLELSLRNPAKDLGIQNLERCKGFSQHLMNLIEEQKSELVEASRTFYYLRFYSTSLTTICEEPHHLSMDMYESVKQFLKNTLIIMEQFKIVLQTCPDEVSLGSELHAVPVLKFEQQFIRYKQDDQWKNCSKHVSTIISTAQKLLANLEKLNASLPSTDFELAKPSHLVISDITSITAEIETIALKLVELNAIFGDVPLMSSVAWLKDEAHKIAFTIAGHTETNESHSAPTKLEKFKNGTEKLLEKILVVVQNIYKRHKNSEKVENKNSEENQEEMSELKEGHLKTLVVEELTRDINILEMKDVLKYLHKVMAEFYGVKSSETAEFKKILSQILPLLEQLILLYEYFITQQVSAYRVTCKMSSILSNIFIELATKGFCVPPEFLEELDSEGQSQQGGGMGLGEGEGEHDVSNKIESEDQLDDAQPAGQEKQKQDDQDCKEEEKGIEMSEDFEGKMQDVEKGEDDDEQSDSNDDADEQMGETEKGADQLDKEIWGSDDEEAAESGDEQDHKEEKGSGGEKDGQDELAAKEEGRQNDEDQNEPSADDSKEKSKKDINEMEEPEYDDEQVDPYHGNHPEYPEPEAMDLPEDLALEDDMQDKDENPDEKNPFDIDAMKEQMPPSENKQDEEGTDKDIEEEKQNEEDNSDNSGDELQGNKNNEETAPEAEEEQGTDMEDNKDIKDPSEKTDDNEETDKANESALDQTQAKEDMSAAMEVDDVEAADNVQTNPSKDQKAAQPNEEVCQEDNPDKEGVGQSRMEQSKTGHKGEACAQEEASSNRQEEEKEQEMRRKPGGSDSKRSLGNVTESVKKKLKTIDVQQNEHEESEDETVEQKQTAEMYQHIKDAKESRDQVLDTATKEQADEQKEVPNLEDEQADEAKESSDTLPKQQEEEETMEVTETSKQKAERLESEKKRVDRGQHPDGEVLEELQDVDIEGDVIETATVSRGGETTHHTQYSSLGNIAVPQLSIQEINEIRTEVEQQLSSWSEPPTSIEAQQAWEKISSMTSSLAQNLSEQLRLVLEPTQASRLKGDYRTGRRINMRKVIPYIASQFRKDKIWLRRTKPSKREYQIALAIDDSSSMSDNHSKELAFESVALISKALTLLESGQLSVLSFGESTEVLHKLTDTFTEKSGSMLLQKFQFTQKKTCVAKLVDFVTEMLNSAHSHANTLIAKLLIIVSDGRGIFSEGEAYMQQAVRRAKLSNIFMVFVIVDNPESKDSILDIRMPVFKDGKLLGIKSYMDSFPFPFYIILRDINSLPSVLSDALRQWFEIVSNIDKQ